MELIYWAVELSIKNPQLRLASPLVAVIALENRTVVNSKAHFVALKSLIWCLLNVYLVEFKEKW